MPEDEQFEVAIVGAGLSSLAAAKAFCHIDPQTKLILLDDNKTLGGVWSQDKIYDGLRTNNLRGTLEFPDYPLHDGFGVAHGEYIPGEALHKYFSAYANHFDIARRIRFETTVVAVRRLGSSINSGWRLSVDTSGQRYNITTDKLIVGTGLTSRPQKMHIEGEEEYGAPFIHAGSLAAEAPAIIADVGAERVTVLGGSKYAWDSVYKFASAGKKIDWIMRKSGHGSTWIVNSIAKLPLLGETWAERLVMTRFITWMSPCFFGGLDGSGWWRRFLHGTWLGRKIVSGFWANMSHDMLEQAGFLNHPNLKPLLPDAEFFDIATSFAVLNYPTDILEFVRSGQVTVYRNDISHLSRHAIHLEGNLTLRSDALVASSGWLWRPNVTFEDTEMHADLGVPSLEYSDAQKEFWASLDSKTDAEVLESFPFLKARVKPPQWEKEQKETQYAGDEAPQYEPQRFYRCIAPAGLAARGDRSLVFAGFGANIAHSIKAEISGLWMYAYMNGLLSVDPAGQAEEVYREASMMQRWSLRRHVYGFGRRYPDYIFDALPWNDVLLKDLGMSGMRKGGSWWRECFEPYGMADYKGVTQEWMELQKRKRE